MLETFQIAAGSVIGKDHISSGKCLIGRNNQDAYAVKCSPDLIVAFVNDGCGSGKHSEVGAWIAANMLVSRTAAYYSEFPKQTTPSTVLPRVLKDVLAQIRLIANTFDGSFSRIINDYFLFTTVGLLITPTITEIVAIGDGVYALESIHSNASTGLVDLGPFPGNMPPYMAYDLVESDIDPKLIKFKVMASMPTCELGGALIGSDGVTDFEHISDKLLPGSKELVGSVNQFWQDDVYFKNPDALGRILRRCNAEVKRIDHETGRIVTHHRLLLDDTTMISVRRMPAIELFHQKGQS